MGHAHADEGVCGLAGDETKMVNEGRKGTKSKGRTMLIPRECPPISRALGNRPPKLTSRVRQFLEVKQSERNRHLARPESVTCSCMSK